MAAAFDVYPLELMTRYGRQEIGVDVQTLAALGKSLHDGWNQIRFGSVLSRPLAGGHQFDVQLYCGDVSADALRVGLFADAGDGSPSMCVAMTRAVERQGAVQGHRYAAGVETQRPAGFSPCVSCPTVLTRCCRRNAS